MQAERQETILNCLSIIVSLFYSTYTRHQWYKYCMGGPSSSSSLLLKLLEPHRGYMKMVTHNFSVQLSDNFSIS